MNTESQPTLRKYASLAGKGLLTLVFPPLGLALASKNTLAGVLVGTSLSIVITGAICAGSVKKIHESPYVFLSQDITTVSDSLMGLVSPISFYMNSSSLTRINPDNIDSRLLIDGHDVINFDAKTGYSVNFPESKKFSYSKSFFNLNFTSLDEISLSLQHAETRFSNILSSGDLIKSKNFAQDLSQSRVDLFNKSNAYVKAKQTLSGIVSNMNQDYLQLKAQAGVKK